MKKCFQVPETCLQRTKTFTASVQAKMLWFWAPDQDTSWPKTIEDEGIFSFCRLHVVVQSILKQCKYSFASNLSRVSLLFRNQANERQALDVMYMAASRGRCFHDIPELAKKAAFTVKCFTTFKIFFNKLEHNQQQNLPSRVFIYYNPFFRTLTLLACGPHEAKCKWGGGGGPVFVNKSSCF